MHVEDDDNRRDRLGEFGCEYFTELSAQFVEDMPETSLIDVQTHPERSVVWFKTNDVTMSVNVYPTSEAVCIGTDTKIPFHAFQKNVAWILRTCADHGVGIDLDLDEGSGETWVFIFLRVFWAGYNFDVFGAVVDDLVRCRRALESRLPMNDGGGPATDA